MGRVTKKMIAWSLYDFGDTAFSALFITFFFPILVKVHLGGNEFHIGLAMGLSVLIAAFLVPFIGAMSDVSGKRMPILVVTALLTAGITVAVGYAALALALVLAFMARITHLSSKDIYDAKMTEVVSPHRFGFLSGLGVGIGYLGTIASLGVGYFLLSHFGWESIEGIRSIFWEVSVFYIVFALPLFILVPDKPAHFKISFTEVVKKGMSEIKSTVRTFLQFNIFARFITASFFYNNGMNTVIIFLALYGMEVIGIGVKEFFPIYAIMALAACVGSLLFGYLSDRYGPVVLIQWLLIVWMVITTAIMLVPSLFMFIVVGVVGGAALGAIWTLNRHMVANISPAKKIAEFFGYEGLTEKFSGFLGPIIFGFLVVTYSYTLALASMLLFFAAGYILMRRL